jgi:hypothetical protein
VGDGVLRYWVLVETSGNQSYIFDTNRLRHAVGASQLIHESTTTWLEEAIGGHDGVDVVQSVSGKALFLVSSPAAGRAIVRTLSERALKNAPGMELTGAVGPGFDAAMPAVIRRDSAPADMAPSGLAAAEAPNFLEALDRTRRAVTAVRSARPSVTLRDLVMPWHEICPESGLPVAGSEIYGSRPRPAAEPVLRRSKARERARARLLGLLGAEIGEVVPSNMEELAHDGWIAIVHADGNGVGALFQNFAFFLAQALHTSELSLEDFSYYLNAASAELQEATCGAFATAVASTAMTVRDPRDTVLPLVIGGDDVTFACHGGIASSLVREFLEQFYQRTAREETLAELTGMLVDAGPDKRPGGLTASAGIAIVKPHHPFSGAYDLAADLCENAKVVKTAALRVPASSFDVHVSVDSTLRSLDTTRAAMTVDGTSRTAAPFVVRHDHGPADRPIEANSEWLDRHDVRHLDAMMALARKLSAGHAHDLRAASDLGQAAYRQVVRAVAEREGLGDAARELLSVTAEPGRSSNGFLRLIDAMLLDGVRSGQAAPAELSAVL